MVILFLVNTGDMYYTYIDIFYSDEGRIVVHRRWRKILCFCIWICLYILILFNKQTVYASSDDAKQEKVEQNNSNNTSTNIIEWEDIVDILKVAGGSILGIVTASIVIYKFVLEKDYDIGEVEDKGIEIQLINKKPLQDIEYTEFVCDNIVTNERIIELSNDPNPYYLDILINISTPDGRKTLKNIVIKKFLISVNGYNLVCLSKNKRLKKCKINRKKKTCRILLKWPTIKMKNDRMILNPIRIFKNPQNVIVYINWYPHIILAPLMGTIFPKKAIFNFEKVEHNNDSPRIVIKSEGLF